MRLSTLPATNPPTPPDRSSACPAGSGWPRRCTGIWRGRRCGGDTRFGEMRARSLIRIMISERAVTIVVTALLATVDNNDTVSYGCIDFATLREGNATLIRRVRQIGICLTNGLYHNRQSIACHFPVFKISTIRPELLCRPISGHITVIYILFAKATFDIRYQLFAVTFRTV